MGDPNALQYQISVLTETQNKSTKQLIKDFRELSRETKNASQGFQKFGGAALAFSFGLPIILQTLSQFSSNEDIKTQAAINGISTAVSMIGTGAFIGAGMGARGGIYGAAAGAVAGGAIATYQFANALKTEDLNNLRKNLQFLQDEFQSSQSSLQKVIPLIEEYKRVQASAADEQTKAFNLEKIVNEISTGLRPLGEETANKVLEAFKNADYDTIGLIINKKLAESSAQLSNEGVKILLEEFKAKGKAIEDPTTAKVIGKSLLSLQASTGESVIRKLAQTEEGKQRIDIVSKNLEKLLEERNRLEVERIEMEKNPIPTISRKNVFGPGGGSKLPSFSEGMANFDDGLTPPQMLKEKVKSLNTNLNDILSTIEPLYKDAEETRVKFAEWKIASGSTALNQESSSALIEQIVKDLRSQGITTKKIDEILRVSAITSIEEYVQAFRNNTLTLRKADEFVKNTLFKRLQDPLEILGKEQGALIQNIGTDILTPYRRDRVYNEIDKATEKLRSQLNDEIIRRERLDAQLANKEITEEQYQKDIEKTIITEDQYRKRLEALREKILLDQRRAGGIFAEDFRGGRQEAREARILGQQTQLEDFGSAFFDEFDNRTEDSYRQVQLGAADTARTIKSEFNNAFLSFANGTETASDAFTKMALNISNKIQQLALEFATNQIFGSLFGSTSNIFGGGSGIGDFFGGLFKSKGGIIKGYSSGGNVTGGSGNKDDIPAMLSGGEYVIRKSAVNKYGSEYLQMLNEGKVKKKAYGGEASFVEENTFKNTYEPITIPETGQTIYRPKDGESSTGFLSIQAIMDSSNPQNELRRQMEDQYYANINQIDDYLKYVEDVRKQNAEAYAENQRLNKEIRDQYNRQKSAASRGAWMSFGLGLIGAGASQFSSMGGFKGVFGSQSKYGASAALGGGSTARQNYANTAPLRYSTPTPRANGGYIRGFANGGSSGKDDIPALLMGGEFVMRKEAVKNYGKKFFDDLNSGRARKFAEGGTVGNTVFGEQGTETYSPTNNVNITVNLNNSTERKNNENDKSRSSKNEEATADSKAMKDLGLKIRNEVVKVITEQQRPGGLLRK